VTDPAFKLSTSSAQFSVFKGDSKELLQKNVLDGTTAYCGWENILLDGKKCSFQMSPFWTTYVGIKHGHGKLLQFKPWFKPCNPQGSIPSRPCIAGCELKSQVEFSPSMLLSGITGGELVITMQCVHNVVSFLSQLSCFPVSVILNPRWAISPPCD